MRAAAPLLLGEQDFAAFTNRTEPDEGRPCARCCGCNVGRYRDFVIVRIEANAFLRGMVRNIVGTLMEVGTGKRDPDDIRCYHPVAGPQTGGPRLRRRAYVC